MKRGATYDICLTTQLFLSFVLVAIGLINSSHADETPDIFQMSLEQLLNLVVTTASGVEESLIDAPAAMVILTERDFKQRSYHSLGDILADLPGFDVIESGASSPITFYQRGYRTPFSTRTLVMVNGVVDNHLWSQHAMLSRQYPISNIERVEVLYGPASVLYGANAFLGIINIITKNADDFQSGEHEFTTRAELGSWNSRGVEIAARGNLKGFRYSLSARLFESDEEDLSDRWGFLSNQLYKDPNIWGPMLDLSNDGVNYGLYYDPTNDRGLLGDVSYGDWKLGLIYWQTDEGYGTNYAADRGQNNGDWLRHSKQIYLLHDWTVSEQLTVTNFVLYRDSRVWGNWVEAEPDWREGMSAYAFISLTNWNATSDAFELKQDMQYDMSEALKIIGGWRYQSSDVTKAYDIPGYWGAYSSTTSIEETGPYGYGAAIFHSTDLVYTFDDRPLDTVPSNNRQSFNDKGVYFGTIYDAFPWRLNFGVRYDNNSLWGDSTSPRLSAIYKFNQSKTAFKVIYGEAFQEPPAQQLYGGWSDRQANADLLPEKANNIELVLMHQGDQWLHDVSLYSARYSNVIREDALNDAERDIWGLEYRGRFEYPNFFVGVDAISGNFYYTYTKAKSSRSFDHDLGDWIAQEIELGDIAPHKVNAAINIPFSETWSVHFKGNFLSRTKLYSRNPLSIQGVEVGGRMIFDLALNYDIGQLRTSVKVENLFDRKVLAPGLRKADSGNDFTQRSKGYGNSLTPLPGQSLWLSVVYTFN